MRKKGKLQLLNSLCISEERLIPSPSPYPSVCNVPLGKVEVKAATTHVGIGEGSDYKLVDFISWIQTYLGCAAKNFNSLLESLFFF